MSTRIADARKNIGMTQKALAEKLGIAASTLNGYEKGNHKPDSEILIAVSNITGCTVDYLLGRVDGFNEFFKKENSPAPAEAEVEEFSFLKNGSPIYLLIAVISAVARTSATAMPIS